MRDATTYQWIIEEGLEEGRKKGQIQERQKIVLNLLNEGLFIDLINRVTGL